MMFCRALLKNFCLLSALMMPVVHASERALPEFYRGVRAIGMGNAFTALSDDHDAVFYNPAGVAFNRNIELEIANPKVEISDDDIKSVSLISSAARELDSQNVSKFFGKKIYFGGTIFPAIHLPGFVLGYYAGTDFHMIARNRALPQVDLRSIVDNGVIMGWGTETRGIFKKHYFRFGFNAKWLIRAGYDDTIPFSTLIALDLTAFRNLQKGPSSGYGGGFGFQYELPITRADDFVLGMAWQDVGDTNFGTADTGAPPSLLNNLSMGGVLIHKFNRISRFRGGNVKLAVEGRHLTQLGVDPRLKFHSGLEVQIGRVSLRGGINQDSFTYGLSLDLKFLKLAVASYGIQTQSLAYQERERRWVAQFSFGLDFGGDKSRLISEEDRRHRPRQ